MLQIGETDSVDKAKFITEGKNEIKLQFNPSEYVFSEEAEYARGSKKGKAQSAQYTGNKPKTLDLTLYFDTSAILDGKGTSRPENSVKEKTSQIEALAHVDEKEHRPALVRFEWGAISFTGLVTSVKTTFTLFNKHGVPIRAKVMVHLQEDSNQDSKIALQSPDRTKTRVLSEDVSIWTLAQKEYGDMGEWRRIAKANQILNPFEIETGRILKVPAIIEEE